jgi:transposase
MPVGQQMAVPTPGHNRKVTAYGAGCYGRGLFFHETSPRTCAWGIRRLVARLRRRARQTHRRIILVLDQGRPNHAQALHQDLAQAAPDIQILWLPPYTWNLNLIERLWKHLKATRTANVLFRSYRQFRRHVEAALRDFARHSDLSMGIMRRKRRRNIRKNLVHFT